MDLFIDIFSKYSPIFVQYVLPFAGIGLILYSIYLVKYIFGGK